ncbi:MAG: sigma-54-dependent Fis family transcriptional regulator [Deltaproteobacteria bacterium]|nr:sigma-54-dependent Fis family transcriptional regulator [Deltaproteobacteria bacterium]
MRILLVEDEEILRVSLARELTRAGHMVDAHSRPASALVAASEGVFDVVVSDIRMPGMDGFDLLEEIRAIRAGVPVVFMTAFGTVRDAVRAMRLGAVDYLTKPFEVDELLALLDRLHDAPKAARLSAPPRGRALEQRARVEELGSSPAMQRILSDLPLVAASDEMVLIWGETGTGKEHLAQIIHALGERADGPFIKVSCAALSEQLVESELFGHEKGAFTGADRQRIGRFERACGGTLMLDEIDDIPLPIQVKLLQVLQDRAIERVGGDRSIPVDVRVLAATKLDLEELVEQGKFRRDLYYRLNVIPMRLPPLRERPEDILDILTRIAKRHARGEVLELTDGAKALVQSYAWPGNVRELENMVKRLVVLAPNGRVEAAHLRSHMAPPRGHAPHTSPAPSAEGYGDQMARVERDLLVRAVEQAGGNRTRAAILLGIPASTLRDKLKKYAIDV